MKKYLLLLPVFLFAFFITSKAKASGPFTLPFYGSQSINAYVDLDSRLDWTSDYVHSTPWLSSDYGGWRGTGYAYDGHQGTDYNLSDNTLVAAAADGTVDSTQDNQSNTYPGTLSPGNYVKINHANNYQTRYYHLKTGTLHVVANQTVVQSEHIAQSDNSGYSSGAHLHFEVRDNGSVVDPYSDDLFTTSPPSLPDNVFTEGSGSDETYVWLGTINKDSSKISIPQTSAISAVTIKLHRTAGDSSCYAQEFRLRLNYSGGYVDSDNTLTSSSSGMRYTFSGNSTVTPNNITSLQLRGYEGGGSGPWYAPCNDWDTNVQMVGNSSTSNTRFYNSHDSTFEPYMKIED